MTCNNALDTRVMNDDAVAYFEAMTVEQADRLHHIFGIDFEMNDGRLSGVMGVRCGMDQGAGTSRTVFYPVYH